jgi:catechol-2,3-dioxygenase
VALKAGDCLRFIFEYVENAHQLCGLHQFPDGQTEPFDERRVGLDHVAFACADRADLQQWESALNELGIAHGGIVDASYGSGLSFRDPDNIALEFFAPPS